MTDDQEYDELTRAIEHAEAWLASKYQVDACVKVGAEVSIGFGKINGAWRLCAFHSEQEGRTALVSSSLRIRLRASYHLPALEEALAQVARERTLEIREATDRYLRFAQRKGDL